MSGKHEKRPDVPWFDPSISLVDLSGYIQAAMHSVIHDESLTDAEKHASLRALAALAGDLSGFWAHLHLTYGRRAERLWNRFVGLDRDGELPSTLLARIEEVGRRA